MTTVPSLQRAAAVSFLVHMAVILVLIIAAKRTPSFVMPSAYTVRLVAPQEAPRARKMARIPPAKKLDKPAVEEEAPPAKPKEPIVPEKLKQPKENLTEHTKMSIESLRKKKERKQYVEDRKAAMEAKRKLRKIKTLGQRKAAVKVSVTPKKEPAEGAPSGVGEGIVSDYLSRVTALIQQEWVFLGADDVSAILSVRILKDGRLVITRIEKASGNALFDRNATRAVTKASPVEPPPYEMEIGVKFFPGEVE